MRVESNNECRNSKWPNSTRLGVSLERLWNVSFKFPSKTRTCWIPAMCLVIYSTVTGSSTVRRWLWHSIRALSIRTRPSAVKPARRYENMKEDIGLMAYQRRPGICDRQALPPYELFEDPGVGELTSFRRRAPQRLCLVHRPKSLSMDRDIAQLNALQHKSLF